MFKVKKIYLLAIFMLLCSFFMVNSSYTNKASAKTGTYCIEATPEVSEKAYEYLDEIYIKKYPALGLEFPFGTEGDKKVLKAAADKITEGAKTDKEKVDRIIKWVDKNIEYRSMYSSEGNIYAIDAYYNKKGNCVGVSQIILNFCRLSGIKAVMCCGPRGDMEKVLTLESKEPDHAWTMIYLDGKWCLYDPLFDVYGSTDKKFIDKWYFFDFIEGVSPYVEKYSKYIFTGDCIFYIDGRFVHYKNGAPSSEFYEHGVAYCGASVNGCMPYFSRLNTRNNGWEYVVNPEKKDSMITDECFYDGWIKYGKSLSYAQPNSIFVGARIMEHEGQTLYFSYMSGAVVLPGRSADYTLTDGYLTLVKGEKVSVVPYWKEEELKEGRVIVWEAMTPEIATVSDDGVITAVSEGLAIFTVSSRTEPDGGNFMGEIVQVSVIPEKRTVSYSFTADVCEDEGHKYKTVTTKATLKKNGKTVKKCTVCGDISKTTTVYRPETVKLSASTYTYNGKTKKPSVTVKDKKGKTLKKDKDYTLKYSKGRKNIGTYTVTVTFKGKYSGSKKLTFKIVPAKATLTKLTAGKKQLTAEWKAVSGATGYEVQYSTSKKFTKKTTKKVTVKKAKTKKTKIKKLAKGKKYYVRLRAYKKVNKKAVYGAWSSVKYVKIK